VDRSGVSGEKKPQLRRHLGQQLFITLQIQEEHAAYSKYNGSVGKVGGINI